jgi:hypothetical protein
MIVLLKIGGGCSAPDDAADMGYFHCSDKLDNGLRLVQYIEQ